MSEREESRPVTGSDDTPEMRIPDGGLGSAMPSWLQQPPAWKREPIRMEAPPRTLPPPDESVIDPATMLDDDDLPAWLRAMARGPEEAAGDEPDQSAADPAGLDSPVENQTGLGGVDVAVEATVPAAARPTPQVPAFTQPEPLPQPAVAVETPRRDPVDVTIAAPQSPNPAPWWLSERALGALLLLMLIAMIYLVLAASGVV